jgi:outer membrane protein assembly factor BamB
MKTKTLLAGCVLLLSCLSAGVMQTLAAKAPAAAAEPNYDWPQFRGPRRDNLSRETGLLKTWPQKGPKLLWTCEEAGIGYSGPAVVGDRLYTMGGDETNDFVIALDTKTGKKVWSTPIGPYVRNNFGSGPRGTPTVDGGRLYALSSSGQLVCLKSDSGEKVWSVSLTGEDGLGGGKPFWNYSESPLVDGDRLVCSPGGSQGTVAALDKETGKVRWRCTELTDTAAYSSMVPVDVGGVRQYVQLTMKGVAGVAAKDGRLLWYYRHPKYRTAVIPTPIVRDNYVYAAVGYGAGDVMLKLTPQANGTKAEQIYNERAMGVMDNKHEGVVLVGDYVYGWSDWGKGWTCQEFKTGKFLWQSKKLGQGSITSAGGMLYCYSEKDGTTALVLATPDGWREKGRFTIPRHTKRREYNNNIWTHPVVANGRLYLRDQELIFCYDVKGGGS